MAKKRSEDMVRSALLLGFGLVDAARSSADKIVKDLKKSKKITKKGSDKAAKDFLEALNKGRKEIETIVRTQTRKVLRELDRATKSGRVKRGHR